MRTIEELMELVIDRVDPDLLVELLDLSSEDICNRFGDRIEDNASRLRRFLGEDDEDEEEPGC